MSLMLLLCNDDDLLSDAGDDTMPLNVGALLNDNESDRNGLYGCSLSLNEALWFTDDGCNSLNVVAVTDDDGLFWWKLNCENATEHLVFGCIDWMELECGVVEMKRLE